MHGCVHVCERKAFIHKGERREDGASRFIITWKKGHKNAMFNVAKGRERERERGLSMEIRMKVYKASQYCKTAFHNTLQRSLKSFRLRSSRILRMSWQDMHS